MLNCNLKAILNRRKLVKSLPQQPTTPTQHLIINTQNARRYTYFDVMQQVMGSAMSQELRSKIPGLDSVILPVSNVDIELFGLCGVIEALIEHQHKLPSFVDTINKLLLEVRC